MRLLVRLKHDALPHLQDHGLARADAPEFTLQIVRMCARPDSENLIDALDEHFGTVIVDVAKNLLIRAQATGPDAKHKAAFEHVINHRHIGRYRGRVAVGQIYRAAAELDLLSGVRQARDKRQA